MVKMKFCILCKFNVAALILCEIVNEWNCCDRSDHPKLQFLCRKIRIIFTSSEKNIITKKLSFRGFCDCSVRKVTPLNTTTVIHTLTHYILTVHANFFVSIQIYNKYISFYKLNKQHTILKTIRFENIIKLFANI